MSRFLKSTLNSVRQLGRIVNIYYKLSSRSTEYLYAPIMAMLLFVCAILFILWSLQRQENSQQELVLFRELAFAKQRIQVNFAENEETFLQLSKRLSMDDISSNDLRTFNSSSSEILSQHPEILQIKWVSPNEPSQFSFPYIKPTQDWTQRPESKQVLENHLKNTLRLTKDTGHGRYSELIHLSIGSGSDTTNRERSWVFWYVQPPSEQNELQNHVAVLYSASNILSKIIPEDLLSRHRFSILSVEGMNLLNTNAQRMSSSAIRKYVQLDIPGENLTLQGESYPVPTNLNFKMFIWLTILLSIFVVWSFYSTWRQMKIRLTAQQDLAKETNFRRAVENSMPVGLRVHDMDGRITYANPAFAKMIGWDQEDLMGLLPPFPFWTGTAKMDNMLKFETTLRTNDAPRSGIEAQITAKDGSVLSVRNFASPLLGNNNEQIGWICSIIDISEPRRIREELAASYQRFTTVLEGLTSAVSVVNPKTGELVFANGLYREYFGSLPDAHLALAEHEMEASDSLFLDEDSVDGFAGLPFSELTPVTGDAREMQIPDNPNWFEVRRRYIPWTDGHLVQMLIATDVSKRRQSEDQARSQEEKLQLSSRLTTMGEMASSLAHELNQPLSAINNYCMGVISRLKIKNDPQINQDIIPALEKAGNQAIRAGNIIQRIRNFVKRSAPQREVCSIEKVLNDSLELADIEAKRQGFKILTVIEPKLPNCFVDPILIEQVLVNLLKNSVDSMRDSIPRAIRFKAPPIQVLVDLDQDLSPAMLRIRVIDVGDGIPSESLAKIYEPFFSTKHEGMGMGLNICRSIIESHQGRLWAENTRSGGYIGQNLDHLLGNPQGCTFTILLPIENYDLEENETELSTSPNKDGA